MSSPESITNVVAFYNGINLIIADLLADPNPPAPYGTTARSFFSGNITTQPAEANLYVAWAINTKTLTLTQSVPSNKNWESWAAALQAQLASLNPSVVSVASLQWLGQSYVPNERDPDVVPDDVVGWTQANLPNSSG